MLQVVSDQPEVVGGLKMVAGCGLAVARGPCGQEMGAGMQDRRRGGDDSGDEVESAGKSYKARAASSKASKSGTSSCS